MKQATLPPFLSHSSDALGFIQYVLAERESKRDAVTAYSGSSSTLQALRRRNADLNDAVIKAYKAETGSLPCNKPKNRYMDVLPYDRTRVLLANGKSREDTYINACWIKEPQLASSATVSATSAPRTWISCQAPIPETRHDFLSMFFDAPVADSSISDSPSPAPKPPKIIVMLTACQEGGRQKASRYWPPDVGETITFEHLVPDVSSTAPRWKKGTLAPIDVTWMESTPSCSIDKNKKCGWNTNRLRCTNGPGREVEIDLVEYLGWQDHGVPDDAREVLQILEHVNTLNTTSDEPVVVHCSAGVGRSGTFIAVAWLVALLQAFKKQTSTDYSSVLQHLQHTAESSPLGPLPSPPTSSTPTHGYLLPSFLRKNDTDNGTPASNMFDPVMAVIDGLRDQRSMMVQTPSQVAYVYECCKVWWSENQR